MCKLTFLLSCSPWAERAGLRNLDSRYNCLRSWGLAEATRARWRILSTTFVGPLGVHVVTHRRVIHVPTTGAVVGVRGMPNQATWNILINGSSLDGWYSSHNQQTGRQETMAIEMTGEIT